MQAIPPEELEAELDALVRLAAQLTESTQAMLVLVDADHLRVMAGYGCIPGVYARAGSACELAIQDRELLELSELSARFTAHALYADAGSYAAVPLCEDGRALGTLAVCTRKARSLSDTQRDQLTALAGQVLALLELRGLRARRRSTSETLYHTVTRITGIGCWQWDVQSGEITLTAEMYGMFGLDERIPLSWDEYVRLLHPDDRAQVLARIEQAVLGESTVFPEYRIIRPDGQVRTLHTTCELQRDPQGNPLRLTGALHDVTAQRAAEEQRKQVALKVVQSQKLESLGVLSGGVAHEFNNLLVGVLGNAELALADRSLAANTRGLMQHIVEAAERAGALTRQLLAYTGRSHLKFVTVDLAACVEPLLSHVQPTLPRGVTLRPELSAGLAVRADLDQLQLLTSNLLLNAAESYGPAGGEVTVRVFALELEEEPEHDVSMPTRPSSGSYVVLEVADRGCGMDRATLERALEPFFSTKFTGRGLGLSAVLGIARSHSGVLTVDSRAGLGSRLSVYFPAQSTATPRVPSEPAQRSDAQLSGRTVLLVDDEPMVRNVERLVMERVGLHVLEASHGQQAIDLLAAYDGRVDLIVLDLVMPGLDASTTLQALRTLRPGIPLLVQSGYSEEDAARSLEQFDGQLAFLQKPFSMQTMLDKVASVLRRK